MSKHVNLLAPKRDFVTSINTTMVCLHYALF